MNSTQEKFLSANDILNTDDMVYEVVDCPEWNGKVCIRSLHGHERDAFESSCITEKKSLNRKGKAVTKRTQVLTNVRAKIVALSACVAPGNPERIFTDAQVIKLSTKNSAPLDKCFEVAARLSRITNDDVEELAGNSESVQSEDSGLILPEGTERQ